MTKQSTISNASIPNYLHATGKVRYRMTNDYLFRAVFQTNQKALTGLLCSLLHLRPEDISDITIRNPIVLGETLDEKTFILDISVLLNQNHIINLEMQIVNEGSWPERSLSYLCRTFDNLTKGDSYSNVTPVTQICFLDFDLFPEFPEFYATYKMLNIKNNHLYSDKFVLSVINLNQITLATEEDKKNHIDDWAALFRTTEWEEIKMLAQNNEYIKEATNTMYMLSEEDRIRQQCESREEYYRMQRYHKNLEEKVKNLEEQAKASEEKAKASEEKAKASEEKAKASEEKARQATEAIAQAEAMMTQAKKVESEAAQKIANAEAKQEALLAELLSLRKELEAHKNIKISHISE